MKKNKMFCLEAGIIVTMFIMLCIPTSAMSIDNKSIVSEEKDSGVYEHCIFNMYIPDGEIQILQMPFMVRGGFQIYSSISLYGRDAILTIINKTMMIEYQYENMQLDITWFFGWFEPEAGHVFGYAKNIDLTI